MLEVRQVGLEPTHPFGHKDLNLARLPIPPLALGCVFSVYGSCSSSDRMALPRCE